MARLKLGELLVQAGAIDELQLRAALGEQRKWGGPLGDTLVKMGMLEERTLVRVLSTQLNTPMVDLADVDPPPRALEILDHEFCLEHRCFPFGYEEQGSFLDLAMADPTNPETFDLIRIRSRCNLRLYLAGSQAIEAAVRRCYLGQDHYSADPARSYRGAWMMSRTDEAILDEDGNISRAPSRTARAAGGTERTRSPLPTAEGSAEPPQQQLAQILDELTRLRSLLERDEKVLTKLMALLIEKGTFSRAELMARLHEEE